MSQLPELQVVLTVPSLAPQPTCSPGLNSVLTSCCCTEPALALGTFPDHTPKASFSCYLCCKAQWFLYQCLFT